MSFIAFNYWNVSASVWKPAIYNQDQISLAEPDKMNPTLTRIYPVGVNFPGMLTDIPWETAPTSFTVAPPATLPTTPPATGTV